MSIRLNFQLSTPATPAEANLDLESASEESLRYEAFTGDIVFEVEGHDFSVRWGWVPVLDFAAALVRVAEALEMGAEQAALDFTESEDEIRFTRRSKGSVEVRSTYTDGGVETRLDALRATSQAFAKAVLCELCNRWPELKHNSDLSRWYPATL